MRGRRKGPLRKITGINPDTRREILECGHEQYPVSDAFGRTNAVRRRCIHCGKAERKKARENMKPGTVVKLPDGREGTVVYHGLDGYGIRWGVIPIGAREVEHILNGDGNTMQNSPPPDFPADLTPEAMLREEYSTHLECVGSEYEIIK